MVRPLENQDELDRLARSQQLMERYIRGDQTAVNIVKFGHNDSGLGRGDSELTHRIVLQDALESSSDLIKDCFVPARKGYAKLRRKKLKRVIKERRKGNLEQVALEYKAVSKARAEFHKIFVEIETSYQLLQQRIANTRAAGYAELAQEYFVQAIELIPDEQLAAKKKASPKSFEAPGSIAQIAASYWEKIRDQLIDQLGDLMPNLDQANPGADLAPE